MNDLNLAPLCLVFTIKSDYSFSMDTIIHAELKKIKDRIVNTISVERIYLFGSYARGEVNKDSDLDLYVVLKDDVQLRDIDAAIKIRQAICEEQTMPIDLLVMKNSQYLERKIAPTLERKVAREGILLYGA